MLMSGGGSSCARLLLLSLMLVPPWFVHRPMATASVHPVHHRLVPRSSFLGDIIGKRADGKPLRVTNQCEEVIHPAISTQAGSGPGTNGFALGSGDSRSLTVSADWQGRVWGRTNCSFNADGTGASNRGGQDGSGRACGTGDCNGMLNCIVSVGVNYSQAALSAARGGQE